MGTRRLLAALRVNENGTAVPARFVQAERVGTRFLYDEAVRRAVEGLPQAPSGVTFNSSCKGWILEKSLGLAAAISTIKMA